MQRIPERRASMTVTGIVPANLVHNLVGHNSGGLSIGSRAAIDRCVSIDEDTLQLPKMPNLALEVRATR